MRFALITLELPLDGGTIEDARTLAALIEKLALKPAPHDGWQPVGRVSDVRLEDRHVTADRTRRS